MTVRVDFALSPMGSTQPGPTVYYHQSSPAVQSTSFLSTSVTVSQNLVLSKSGVVTNTWLNIYSFR